MARVAVGRFRSGWFGESYRHYLAAKGVATRQKVRGSRRYFVRDQDKGPVGQPRAVAIARSRGFSNSELRRNGEVRAELEAAAGDPPGTILRFIETRSRSSRQLPESLSATEGDSSVLEDVGTTEELPDDAEFVPFDSVRDEGEPEDVLAETIGVPMMGAPPVPSSPSSASSAPFKMKRDRWPVKWEGAR